MIPLIEPRRPPADPIQQRLARLCLGYERLGRRLVARCVRLDGTIIGVGAVRGASRWCCRSMCGCGDEACVSAGPTEKLHEMIDGRGSKPPHAPTTAASHAIIGAIPF